MTDDAMQKLVKTLNFIISSLINGRSSLTVKIDKKQHEGPGDTWEIHTVINKKEEK